MLKQAFSNEKYVALQSKHINERINQFNNKLYLEFGGKLFDDNHASRVLPGFKPDSKLKMLLSLKDKVEIIIAICANDIEKQKIRGDLGITYDDEVLRLINDLRNVGLYVGSVTITQYNKQSSIDPFIKKLSLLNIPVFFQYRIEGYPNDTKKILSDEGFGKNDYIKTSKPLVVVTAPGPGSGKMATCLSQLYHDHKNHIDSGYAKFETFPVWSLPLNHPVNLAYEAATVDLNDVNMIDPFHLETYQKTTVNYNRDVEIFPVLHAIFESIYQKSPYHSPTDMGVNMAGFAIIDDEAACKASRREIVRRYYQTKVDYFLGKINQDAMKKMERLLTLANVHLENRKCAEAAKKLEQVTEKPTCAIELPDGKVVTGKTSDLLRCSSAAILNALKYLAKLDDIELISPDMLEPILKLKLNVLNNTYPNLDIDEVLLTLSIAAKDDQNAKKAMEQVQHLSGSEIHSTVILSNRDIDVLRKLNMNLTQDPKYAFKK